MFHFPGGLRDFLNERLTKERRVVDDVFFGRTDNAGKHGSVEWAVSWFAGDGLSVPTATPCRHRKAELTKRVSDMPCCAASRHMAN